MSAEDSSPIFKTSWLQSIKRPLLGFIYSIAASLFNATANILIKKTELFNGVDHLSLRFVIQLIILMFIAKIFHQKHHAKDQLSFFDFLLGPKDCRNLLIARGSCAAIGLISLFFSIKLINPADAISLYSCNIIFIVILSRIFIKEKFTIAHVIAFIFIVLGTLFITQPTFLVNSLQKNVEKDLSNLTTDESIPIPLNKTVTGFFSKSAQTTLGIILGLVSGFILAVVAIIIKELSKRKVHYSIMNLYASYFGLPKCVLLIFISIQVGYDVKDLSIVHEPDFIYEIIYLIIASVTGVVSQIFWIIAMKYEDASKVAMYRTTDLLFTFLFQYFYLGISSNIFSISGAIFIFFGMMLVIGDQIREKYVRKKEQKRPLMMNKLLIKEETIDGSEIVDNTEEKLLKQSP